jgi:hypothetical protein
MVRHPECRYREETRHATLLWTRGRVFPLSPLESRLRCPTCGSRDVVLLITIPEAEPGGFEALPCKIAPCGRSCSTKNTNCPDEPFVIRVKNLELLQGK